MGVSKPTANNMIKKLTAIGWVVYEKYKPILLTEKGKKEASLIVRKHRLSEIFLSKIMGFGWEEVHDIAEDMEHLKSEKLFDRMNELLGFPKVDPHGSPIPNKCTGCLSLSLDEVYSTTLYISSLEDPKLPPIANPKKKFSFKLKSILSSLKSL